MNTNAVTKAEIWFHTKDENKDGDTTIWVTIYDPLSGFDVAGFKDNIGEFDDNSTFGPFPIGTAHNRTIASNPERLLQMGLSIQIFPQGIGTVINGHPFDSGGNDEWHFDFSVRFILRDGSRLNGTVKGVNLDQDRNFKTLLLSDIEFTQSAAWFGIYDLEIRDAPAVVKPTSDTQDIYVRSIDDRLYQRWWTGSTWSDHWQVHEDGDFRLGSAPSVVSNGASYRDVYVRGADGYLYHKYWNGRTWYGWFPLGGETKDAPAVVMPRTNSRDVYVRGMDDRLWQKWWTGSSGSEGWYMHDDGAFRLGSAPAVVSNGENYRAVYVRGTDGALYYKNWDGRSWHSWICLGGKIKGAPVAIKLTHDSQDIYVRGMDDRLWQIWRTGVNWSDWHMHDDGDFRLSSSPAVVSNGENFRDVYVRGVDGTVYHKFWDGRTWNP
jgi:hypothetical protein